MCTDLDSSLDLDLVIKNYKGQFIKWKNNKIRQVVPFLVLGWPTFPMFSGNSRYGPTVLEVPKLRFFPKKKTSEEKTNCELKS